MNCDAYYRFTMGNFECVCISDGGSKYPLELLFKNIPRQHIEGILREKNLPTDHIWTPYTYLFVNTGQHRVLVDMGAGPIRPTTGKLIKNMKVAGIDPRDISTVLITHAHPDHIGGTLDEGGKPIYANARYFIWKSEWEFWFSENAINLAVPKPAAERFVTTARANLLAINNQIDLVEVESEIHPGIHAIPAPGHTPGHMVVSFSSNGERLLYIGDTVLHPLHLSHPDWLPIFDIHPEEAANSKRRVFDLAAAEHAWVVGQHFPPFPSLGHVIKGGSGWQWQPIEMAKTEN
jgi:glyoxylase-like metal-dependent hydrolase (beta-lactamase superfamily II)